MSSLEYPSVFVSSDGNFIRENRKKLAHGKQKRAILNFPKVGSPMVKAEDST